MLSTFATTIALGSIGTELCFRTITLTCSKTIDLISYFLVNVNPNLEIINQLLMRTDLKIKINKINQLIIEFTDLEQSGHKFKQSIKMSISDVNDAMNLINVTLDKIRTSKEDQEQLYLSSWRPFNYKFLIEDLQFGIELLNNRFSDLEKIISIVHNLNK